jgi:hypothetical protein
VHICIKPSLILGRDWRCVVAAIGVTGVVVAMVSATAISAIIVTLAIVAATAVGSAGVTSIVATPVAVVSSVYADTTAESPPINIFPTGIFCVIICRVVFVLRERRPVREWKSRPNPVPLADDDPVKGAKDLIPFLADLKTCD